MSKKVQRLENVLGVLRKRKAEFEATYGVTRIGIFGSLARGEAGLDSDVDIAVEMRKPDLF
jgi:predicted nucleotidyltransferase